MRNRNKGNLSLCLFCVIIFTALLTGLNGEKSEKSSKVKILIFLKYVKLLKSGDIGSIELSFPGGSDIDIDGRRVYCKKLSLSFVNNSFIIKGDDRIIKNSNLIIYPKKIRSLFIFELNEEKRTYPLPLFINANKDLVEFSIEEDVDQYALDSAWSELGYIPEQNLEALYSLAYIIKARSEFPYLKNKHNGYDFCDLTCCQTYRGLSGKTFRDDISVKTDNIKDGLFFHSSSGGRLFTEYIFNNKERVYPPPKDVIFSENFVLSRNNFKRWEASIAEIELMDILYKERPVSLKDIKYDRERELIFISTSAGDEEVSPESFRLKINRVKGWNFIKSNNYVLANKNGDYIFNGSGLGHGAGMSLEGAVQLAERGYSRYEILEHYYPDIQYKADNDTVDYRFHYIVFDYTTEETIRSNLKDSFRNRIIPCGSIFKLFAAIYLAYERTDLFYNHIYTCTDKHDDKAMPEYCWYKKGHGRMNLVNALSHSCNKYFASLYRYIDRDDFNRWLSKFIAEYGIKLHIPEINNKSDFPYILAGLNFNVTISVTGLMKLNRFIYAKNTEHSSEKFVMIFNALHKTFIDGTAKDKDSESQKSLWGKTGTVIAGTNNHYGYGIFIGGSDSAGIVSIFKKSTGANAAKESKKILINL
ncbi:MAG: penicillin-binding transpeptidase domain-containing protein [Spirochaetes bacterium]|nr:penicillin-binding transpeptidase domain-containing protein [Spirochaetota bacterium]